MKIVKRIKNQKGMTIAYMIDNDGIISRYTADDTYNLSNLITNAVLVGKSKNDFYFRGKDGVKIDTVVEYNKQLPKKLDKDRYIKEKELSKENYYGESYIKICRQIRLLADKNMLDIDTEPHISNDGNNIELFKLIEACDIDLRTFIQMYLSNIQPYSLSPFQGKKSDSLDSQIWLSDAGYGIQFLIKLNLTNKRQPMVVSFHESNVNHHYRPGKKKFSDKLCAVFIYNVKEGAISDYNVFYTVQRGFVQLNLESETAYVHNDIALVSFSDIESQFDKVIQNIMHTLQTNYNGKRGAILVNNLQSSDFSFMSLGYATANNLCFLIDLFAQHTDSKDRMIIVEITYKLLSETTAERLKQLKEALKPRYLNTSNVLYKKIEDF